MMSVKYINTFWCQKMLKRQVAKVILCFVWKDVAKCKCSSHKIDIIEPDTEKRKSLVLFSEFRILLPGWCGENHYKSGHVIISSYAGGEKLLRQHHICDIWLVVILRTNFYKLTNLKLHYRHSRNTIIYYLNWSTTYVWFRE